MSIYDEKAPIPEQPIEENEGNGSLYEALHNQLATLVDYNDSIIENSKLTLSNSEFLIILKQNELDEILKKNYQFDYYKTDQINEGLKRQAKAFCIFVVKTVSVCNFQIFSFKFSILEVLRSKC